MSRPARRATIIDVAERAGVSRQTVTRAINDMPGISAAGQQQVHHRQMAAAGSPQQRAVDIDVNFPHRIFGKNTDNYLKYMPPRWVRVGS